VWYSGLLWLVIFAVVSRCDLMYRLIRLHTRGCVGSQIRLVACLSIGKYVAQLTVLETCCANYKGETNILLSDI